MRSPKTNAVVILALMAAAVLLPAQEVVDRIVARMDTDIILLSDVRLLAHYQLFVDGKSESDDVILDRLIDQWIVKNEAKASLFPQPSDDDVNRSLQRLKRSFSSPEEFEERKKQSGMPDDEILRMLRLQLYLSNYLDSRFRASIQVDEKEIEEFYRTRVIPRAESRGQKPPALDAAKDFIQEVLVQRAITAQSERWLKESRARIRIEKMLSESQK